MAVDPQTEAAAKVAITRQVPRQMFAKYAETMHPYFAKCGYGDIAIIDYIKKNMHPGLWNKMAGMESMLPLRNLEIEC